MDFLKNKNILVLSTNDTNGAGDAMYKIAILLRNMSYNVKMVVNQKTKHDDFILQYIPQKDRSFLGRGYNKIKGLFKRKSVALKTHPKYLFFSQDESKNYINAKSFIEEIRFNPDYIFTGLTFGFLTTTDIKNIALHSSAKVFNITVDMNHFTGGCHYSWSCKGYESYCENCPAILNPDLKYIAEKNLRIKLENAQAAQFNIIAGSGLTLKQAEKSTIYKNQVYISNINSVIDTSIMNARNKEYAKNVFGFEYNKFYILAGAYYMNDERKGFAYLVEALNIIYDKSNQELKDKMTLVIVTKNKSDAVFENIKMNKIYVDFVKDYRLLSQLYQAADVFVNTSIEDSGPMMVSEALACGTPVVGFDMGVVTNMVITGYNGYKAELKNSEDLAKGIETIYNLNSEEFKLYSNNAVAQVKEVSSYEYATKIFCKILNEDD